MIHSISTALANRLISIPKVIEGDATLDLLDAKTRYNLKSEQEPDYQFLFEVTSNKKMMFRISLHHQEDNTKIGLMRVDFKGGHINPVEVNEFVPENMRQYAGLIFTNEAHIHYHVEGYKSLAWAIPLKDTDFATQDINNTDEFADAVSAFVKKINIITPITIIKSAFL